MVSSPDQPAGGGRIVTIASFATGFQLRHSGHLTVRSTNMIASRWQAVHEEVRASSIVHLPCAPASVGVARRALCDDLRSAGVPDLAVRDAALVVSELLSNAILHAYPLPGERLQVTWSVNGGTVEVAVSDGGSATMPHAGHPPESAVGGRGLAIVAHLSQTWGVRTDEVGLTVWAVLSIGRPDNRGNRRSAPTTVTQPGVTGQQVVILPGASPSRGTARAEGARWRLD